MAARAQAAVAELVAAVRERAERSGELAFLLEPDLKECRGGLRDVHAMTAAAAPGSPTRRPTGTRRDEPAARRTGRLHQRALDQNAKRPSDRLVLQEQAPVAQALGLADPDALDAARSTRQRAIIAFAGDLTWRRVDAALRPPRRSRPRLFGSAASDPASTRRRCCRAGRRGRARARRRSGGRSASAAAGRGSGGTVGPADRSAHVGTAGGRTGNARTMAGGGT